MTPLALKSVQTNVRPARIATLINQNDEHWQSTCQRVIEFYSKIWGGANNIIIPTDGDNITDDFWHILDAYDADYFYYYYKSDEDIKFNDPETYNKHLEAYAKHRSQWAEDETKEDVKKWLDKELSRNQGLPTPSERLQQRLKIFSPFYFEKHIFEHGVSCDTDVRYPLTSIITILPYCKPPKFIGDYEPAYDGVFPLWLASITGLATDKFLEDLGSVKVQSAPVSPSNYDPLEVVLSDVRSSLYPLGQESTSIFNLSNIQLAYYQPISLHTHHNPTVVVVGETVADFCLYYSLARLKYHTVWMPLNWLNQNEDLNFKIPLMVLFARMLKDNIRQGPHHPKLVFNSASLSESEMTSVIKDLDTRDQNGIYFADFRSFEGDSVISSNIKSLTSNPYKLYERDNYARPSTVMAREGTYIDTFNSPKPKNFSEIHPYDHRWITDISISNHKLPRHYLLGDKTIHHPLLLSNGARISTEGYSYFCPSSMYPGFGDVDTILVRPTIQIPSSLQIFEWLFKEHRYNTQLSDKGIYANETIQKFGDLPSLARLLRSNPVRNLLCKYVDNSAQSGPEDGYVINDRRRYLNFPAIKQIIGTEAATNTVIEQFTTLGIFHRGFIFKCSTCKNTDWYSLDEISQTFVCKRCKKPQHIGSKSYFYGQYEPGLFYKIDEVVYQFILNNGYVALLAVDQIRMRSNKGAQNSFLYTPDLEVHHPEHRPQELDILCINDGEIILGEAKKENRLGSTNREENNEIVKYFSLAKKIGARKLAFATFTDGWSDRTIKNIQETINSSLIEIVYLTKEDLLKEQHEIQV